MIVRKILNVSLNVTLHGETRTITVHFHFETNEIGFSTL